MNIRAPLLAVILAPVIMSLPLEAQDNPDLAQGLKPFGAFHGGEIDTVNTANGNLVLHTPFISYPQRGGKLTLNFSILYNNKGWQVWRYGTGPNSWLQWTWVGSGVQIPREDGIRLVRRVFRDPGGGSGTTDVVWQAVTQDGSIHYLGSVTGSTMETIDGTGIRKIPSSNNLLGMTIDRNGIRRDFISGMTGVADLTEDSNGNRITPTGSAWIDTLGRTIPTSVSSTDLSGCPAGATEASASSIPGPNGGASTIKYCYTTMTFETSFGVLGIREGSSGPISVLIGIVLPDQAYWSFNYNSYGDLVGVRLPTGGTISYQWTTLSSPPSCGSSLTSRTRAVAARSLDANDGTGPRTWTYTWRLNLDGFKRLAWTVITDPALNDSVHVVNYCSGYESVAQLYQGSYTNGTLLKTVTTEYQSLPNPYASYTNDPTRSALPYRITTIWPNGKVSQVVKVYDSSLTFYDANVGPTPTYQSTNGNILEADEFDYGQNTLGVVDPALVTPGPLLRKTITAYRGLDDPNYKNLNLLNLPSSVTVQNGSGTQVAGTTFDYDQPSTLFSSGITTQLNTSPATSNFRGNRTTTSRWLNTTGGYLTGTATFYDTGMPYQGTDPGGHTISFSYSPTFAGAYLTQTQLPDTNSPDLAHHLIAGNYDFNTGLLTSYTDQNNNTTTYAYDNMRRLTTVNFPDSGVSNFFYPDSNTVERQQQIDGTRSTDLFVRFDGLGRQTRRITANDESTPWDQVDTCYEARGLMRFKSYPYQGTGLSAPPVCSGAGDTFSYDGLGRVTQAAHSDGTSVSTDYLGPATRLTDEGNGSSGVQRVSQVDGLGRLVSVCEVSSVTLVGPTGTPGACGQDIAAPGFLTAYQYDALDNLISVTQSGLNSRTFQYDSLSRLSNATNPESGTTTYQYDADGNVIQRVRPAPNQPDPAVTLTTTMTYDPLHRLRTRSYSASTVPITINYDQTAALGMALSNTTGRKSSESTNESLGGTVLNASVFSYDSMGRVWGNSQCTTSTNCLSGVFPVSYMYDLAGNMTSATNGVGVQLSFAYNRASRLTTLSSSLIDAFHPGTLLTGIHYNAFGSVLSQSLGNGVNESLSYTARGWLQALSATAGTSTLYSFGLTFAGNGNVLSANDSVNGNWTYGYDDFNRLKSASATGQAFTYDYDRFGNRWHQNGPNMSSLAFDANNRIMPGSSVSYDAAGNVTSDGNHTYAYDAENRITAVDGGTTGSYSYDAEGRRVVKATQAGAWNLLYDLAGREVTEVPVGGAWTRGEIYAGGRHLATYSSGAAGMTYFTHPDWLGTERARTDAFGSAFETCTSLPFGDALVCSALDSSPMHFTGKERDAESGLDNFGARYDASSLGRFMTYFTHPDWLGTERARTDAFGSAFETCTSLPFGDALVCSASDPSPMHFTGKERDAESGLDNFGARYDASSLGRFMTPDPLPWLDWQHGNKEEREKFADFISNPQNLNMYSYVDNNPTTKTDPTGMLGCQSGNKKFGDCKVIVVYDKDKSKGTLYLVGQNKGDKHPTILLKTRVVVGGDGHLTPTGTFTAAYWEKDHVSTKYGTWANTPYSKTTFGINAFGPFQLHMKELEGQGIYIHGTIGPENNPFTFVNMVLGSSSHGCVRMCNRDDVALHNMMPDPKGNKVIISTNPNDAPED